MGTKKKTLNINKNENRENYWSKSAVKSMTIVKKPCVLYRIGNTPFEMPTTDWNYHIREKGLDFLFPFPLNKLLGSHSSPSCICLSPPLPKPWNHGLILDALGLSSPFPSCPHWILVRKDFNLIWPVVSSLSLHTRFTIFFHFPQREKISS